MATITLEAHTLDTRTGEWCDSCGSDGLASVTCVLVNADTLAVLGRFVGAMCESCGHESVHR